MASNFSQAKPFFARGKVLPAQSLQCGGVPDSAGEWCCWAMAALPETPEEIERRKLAQLAEQRIMLEYLPKWLKLRGLRQKDVAHALGVSEATVSSWIKGTQGMSVGQLRQIAVLLKANPGDLLRDPADQPVAQQVEETLTLMDALTEEEWQVVLQTARAISSAKQKNSG